MLRLSVRRRHDYEPGSVAQGNAAGLAASEKFCRDLTRREAKNFYWGFIALPPEQRTAIYALYGFARQVDDDADLAGIPHGPDRFLYHRERLRRCLDGEADDPVMHVLADAVDRFGIPAEDLECLIRGVECDLQTTRYETWEDLRAYCLLVASSIGRMCVRIFGFNDPAAFRYADDLGIAMQLANILRDVREDLDMGRIYLPAEDLRAFGVAEAELVAPAGALRAAPAPGPGWEALVQFEVERAEELFGSGLRVVQVIPRRAGVCVLTMAGIYQQIIREIARNPRLPLQQRASLTGRSKLAVMARSWLQAI
jgi:phytoene synthase